MEDQVSDRRRFLKSAVAGSAVAAVGLPNPAVAQGAAAPAAKAPALPQGYAYLNPEEAAFVGKALAVEHPYAVQIARVCARLIRACHRFQERYSTRANGLGM